MQLKVTPEGRIPVLSRGQSETGTTLVLGSARRIPRPGAGTMMSVHGCCVPQALSGTKCEPVSTPPFTLLHYYRNKQGLRDPRTCQQFKLGPGDFPRFLWEGETMDWTDPAIGFLRHPILFAVRTPTGFRIQC